MSSSTSKSTSKKVVLQIPLSPSKHLQSWKHLPSLVCDCFISVSPLHTSVIALLERSFLALQTISVLYVQGWMLIPPSGLVLKNRECLRPDLICACKQHTLLAGEHLLYSGRGNHHNGEHLHLIFTLTVTLLSFIYFSRFFPFSLSPSLIATKEGKVMETHFQGVFPVEEVMSEQNLYQRY